MSFHEEIFPIGVSYGAVGGPKFKTTILPLMSGYEKRNIDWSNARAEYDVSYGLKTLEELEEIRDFFYARRGMAYGFRFRDWQDYKLTNEVIGLTTGALTTYQIFKRYQSGAVVYDRVLRKIETGGVVVTVAGVIRTVGLGGTSYQINLNTGVITLGATLAALVGESIAITCNFHVPVRFDTDHLATTIEEYNVFTWGQIPLVEVRV